MKFSMTFKTNQNKQFNRINKISKGNADLLLLEGTKIKIMRLKDKNLNHRVQKLRTPIKKNRCLILSFKKG